LLSRALNLLAAGGAFRVLKELQFPAAFVITPDHQQFPAGVAFFAADKGLTPTDRAVSNERPAAAGAYSVASFNGS